MQHYFVQIEVQSAIIPMTVTSHYDVMQTRYVQYKYNLLQLLHVNLCCKVLVWVSDIEIDILSDTRILVVGLARDG